MASPAGAVTAMMQQLKERAALGSIAASAGLTAAKAVVGFMSGSLAILSEAAHSLIDLAATVMTYFAVRIAGKPADEEHHYGHGKVESVAALAETALLFVLAGVVFWEAIKRLIGAEAHAVEATVAAFVVIGVSIVVDFFRSRTLYRVAAQSSSHALEADALHFSSDLWSSLAVLVGLAGVALGYVWADAAAALVVAIFVCLAGWRLARRTIDALTDTAPAGVAERIDAIARRVKGVTAVERVRARPVGPVLFVDLGVSVSRTLPLDRVSALQTEIGRAVRSELPGAEVTVTTSPRALDDETVLERVMVIARNRGQAVHHVTVHHLKGRLAVSLDIEVDGAMALGRAHEIASDLERAIDAEFEGEVEVETHIEPLQTYAIAGREAAPARVAAVADALKQFASEIALVGEIHDVRVREAPDGEVVNFHCRVAAGISVREAHDKVDELERRLREQWPSIKRVIGHAEPTA
jgi:cation diffusion facilitator family transporter